MNDVELRQICGRLAAKYQHKSWFAGTACSIPDSGIPEILLYVTYKPPKYEVLEKFEGLRVIIVLDPT